MNEACLLKKYSHYRPISMNASVVYVSGRRSSMAGKKPLSDMINVENPPLDETQEAGMINFHIKPMTSACTVHSGLKSARKITLFSCRLLPRAAANCFCTAGFTCVSRDM
jgi:hypothetical protein